MAQESVLAAANFPANTGYAWDRLEAIYAQIADRLEQRGIKTYVAYPSIESPPGSLAGSAAVPVELDVSLNSWRSLHATSQFVARENVGVLYLMDRPSWHFAFPVLRMAGVSHIVVHDNNSGKRTARKGMARAVKKLLVRLPGVAADRVVAASNFVAGRQVRVNQIPSDRITTIYYAVEAPESNTDKRKLLTDQLGLGTDRPVIGCTARASVDKGVHHLIRSVRLLMDSWPSGKPEPALIYCGSGPELEEWKKLASDLGVQEHVIFAGYVENAVDALRDARVFAVPSVWQDAFPYAVLEPMARGKPVVGSRVGGIPEQITHGTTGFLVDPKDHDGLAESLRVLLLNPERAARMGENARRWVKETLDPETQYQKYAAIVEEGLRQAHRDFGQSR